MFPTDSLFRWLVDRQEKLLDVGCGTTATYQPGEMEVYGIDLSREMLKHFRNSYLKTFVVVADAKKIPFRSRVFDVAVSNVLLHHLTGQNPNTCKARAL